MRRAAWVALPLAVAIGAVLWLSSSREERAGALEPSKGGIQVNGPSLEQRMLALEAENRRMRGELAMTRAQAGNLKDEVDQVVAEARSKPENAAEPADEPVESDEQREHRREASLAAYEAELQSQAKLEPRDSARTAIIEELFGRTTAEVGHGLSVESAACGRALCEVVVSHEHELAHTALTDALQTRREHIGRALIRRHPVPSGGYQTTYYFSRPGEPLASLDQALVGEYN